MSIYRRIYEHHHGPIPKGYHIHHIDGNRNNNNIGNLIALSPEDHYNIHHNQEDWGACWAMIFTGHISKSFEERSEMSRKTQLSKLEQGTHHFLRTDWRRDYTGNNNPNYGNAWSEEQRKYLSELRIKNEKSKGKNNPMYGVKRPDLVERNKSGIGKHWYTDGINSKQYFPNEAPEGWRKGRIIYKG